MCTISSKTVYVIGSPRISFRRVTLPILLGGFGWLVIYGPVSLCSFVDRLRRSVKWLVSADHGHEISPSCGSRDSKSEWSSGYRKPLSPGQRRKCLTLIRIGPQGVE